MVHSVYCQLLIMATQRQWSGPVEIWADDGDVGKMFTWYE